MSERERPLRRDFRDWVKTDWVTSEASGEYLQNKTNMSTEMLQPLFLKNKLSTGCRTFIYNGVFWCISTCVHSGRYLSSPWCFQVVFLLFCPLWYTGALIVNAGVWLPVEQGGVFLSWKLNSDKQLNSFDLRHCSTLRLARTPHPQLWLTPAPTTTSSSTTLSEVCH